MKSVFLLLLLLAIANAAIPIDLHAVSWTNFDEDEFVTLSPQLSDGGVDLTFAYSCEINMVFVLAKGDGVLQEGTHWIKNEDNVVVDSSASEHFKYLEDVNGWQAMFQVDPHEQLDYVEVHVELTDNDVMEKANIQFTTACATFVKGNVWLDCNKNGVFDLQEAPFTQDVWVYLCLRTKGQDGMYDDATVFDTKKVTDAEYKFKVELESPSMHVELHSDEHQSCSIAGPHNTVFPDLGMHTSLKPPGWPFTLVGDVEVNFGFFDENPQLSCPGPDTLTIEEKDELCLMPYPEKPVVELEYDGCGTFKASPVGVWPPTLIIGTNTVEFRVDANDVVPETTCNYVLEVVDECVPELKCPEIKSCCSDPNKGYRTITLTPPKVYHAAQENILTADIVDTSGTYISGTADGKVYQFVVQKDHFVTWEVDNDGVSKNCTTRFDVNDCEDPVCDVSEITTTPSPPEKLYINTNIRWDIDMAKFLFDNADEPPTAHWSVVDAAGNTVEPKTELIGTSITWTPSVEDTYVLRFDVQDTTGNIGSCELPFVVFDNTLPSCPSELDYNNGCNYTDPTQNCHGSSSNFCTDLGSHLRSLTILEPDVPDTVEVEGDAPEEFPIGTTTIQWKLMNEHGFVKTCTEDVTVVDCEKPECGPVEGCVNFCGVGRIGKPQSEAVFVINPTDNSGGKVTVTGPTFPGHVEGENFGYGEHDAKFEISDRAGETEECPFKFYVEDCTDPWCVPKLDSGHEFCVNNHDLTKWMVDLEEPELHDYETDQLSATAELFKEVDGAWVSEGDLEDFESLGVGKYKVEWNVTDDVNYGLCAFEFEVIDCEPPHCNSFDVTVCDGEVEEEEYRCDGKFMLDLQDYITNQGGVIDNIDGSSVVPQIVDEELRGIIPFDVSTTAETVDYVVEDSSENQRTCTITLRVEDCCNPTCDSGAITEGFLVQFGETDGETEDGVTKYCDEVDNQHERTFSWVYPENFFDDNGEIVEVWSVVTTEDGSSYTLTDEPANFTFTMGTSTVEFYAKDAFGNEIESDHCPVELHIADCTFASCDADLDYCENNDCCNNNDKGYKEVPANDLHPDASDGYSSDKLKYESNYFARECDDEDIGPCYWNNTETNEIIYRLPINKRVPESDRHVIPWNITDPDGNVNVEGCSTIIRVLDCQTPSCPPVDYEFCIATNTQTSDFTIPAPSCTDNRAADGEILMTLTVTRNGQSYLFSDTKNKTEWDAYWAANTLPLTFTDTTHGDEYYIVHWEIGDLNYEASAVTRTDEVLVKDCHAPECSIVHTAEACAVARLTEGYFHLVTDVTASWVDSAPGTGDVYVDREEGKVKVLYHCNDANAEYDSVPTITELSTEVQHCYKPENPGTAVACDDWNDWNNGATLELGWHAWRVRGKDEEAFEDNGSSPYDVPLDWASWVYSESWTEVVDCTGPQDCDISIAPKCAHADEDGFSVINEKHMWNHATVGDYTVTNCKDASPVDPNAEIKYDVTVAPDVDEWYGLGGPHVFTFTVTDALGNNETYNNVYFTVYDCLPPKCIFNVDGDCADLKADAAEAYPTLWEVDLSLKINCWDASGISKRSPDYCEDQPVVGDPLIDGVNTFALGHWCVNYTVTQFDTHEPPYGFDPQSDWDYEIENTVHIHDEDGFDVSDCTGPQDCNIVVEAQCAIRTMDGIEDRPHMWNMAPVSWDITDCKDYNSPSSVHNVTYVNEGNAVLVEKNDLFGFGPHELTFWMEDQEGNLQSYKRTFKVFDCVAPNCTLTIPDDCANEHPDNPHSHFNTSRYMTLSDPVCEDANDGYWSWGEPHDCSDATKLLADGYYLIGDYCVEYTVNDTSPHRPEEGFDNYPENLSAPEESSPVSDDFTVKDCEPPVCEPPPECPCNYCSEYIWDGPGNEPPTTLDRSPDMSPGFVSLVEENVNDERLWEETYGFRQVQDVEPYDRCYDYQYDEYGFHFVVDRWLEVENAAGVYEKVTSGHDLGWCYYPVVSGTTVDYERASFDDASLPDTDLYFMLKVGNYRVGMTVSDGIPWNEPTTVPPEGCLEFTIYDCINPFCKSHNDYEYELQFPDTYHIVDPDTWWTANWPFDDSVDENLNVTWNLEGEGEKTLEELKTMPFIPGTYNVEMTVEDDGQVPLDPPGDPNSNTCSGKIVITAKNATVRGTVWADTDQDQTIDQDEHGIPDVKVELWKGAGPSTSGGDGFLVATMDTRDDGTYEFEDLLEPCTLYTVVIPDVVVVDGVEFHQTNPTSARSTVWGAWGTSVSTNQIMPDPDHGECYQKYGTEPDPGQLDSLLPGEDRDHFDFGFDRCHLKCALDGEDENDVLYDLMCVRNDANCTTCSALQECAPTDDQQGGGMSEGSVKEVVRQLMRKRNV